MSKKLQFIFGGIIIFSILIGISIKKVFKKNHIIIEKNNFKKDSFDLKTNDKTIPETSKCSDSIPKN